MRPNLGEALLHVFERRPLRDLVTACDAVDTEFRLLVPFSVLRGQNNIKSCYNFTISVLRGTQYVNNFTTFTVAGINDSHFTQTRQVTRAMHVRNRVCPRIELILKIIIILLIIFIGFIKSKPC